MSTTIDLATSPPDLTDDSDADDQDSAMIALLPITSDWCKIDLPHMTLVYAGLIKDLSLTDFNELAKDAASLAMISNTVYTKVSGVEVFGDTEKVNVLKLQMTPELFAMRKFVEKWNVSKFPFSPHCTIGPVGPPLDYPPNALAFNRIMVGWGNDQMTFRMGGTY